MSTDYSVWGTTSEAYDAAVAKETEKKKAGTNPLELKAWKIGLFVVPLLLISLYAMGAAGTIPADAMSYVKIGMGVVGGCWGATIIGYAISSVHANKERIAETSVGKLAGKVVTALKTKAKALKDKVVQHIWNPLATRLGPHLGPHKKAITTAIAVAFVVATAVLAILACAAIGTPGTSIAAGVMAAATILAFIIRSRVLKKEEELEGVAPSPPAVPAKLENEGSDIILESSPTSPSKFKVDDEVD